MNSLLILTFLFFAASEASFAQSPMTNLVSDWDGAAGHSATEGTRSGSFSNMGKGFLHRESLMGFTSPTRWKSMKYSADMVQITEASRAIEFSSYKFMSSLVAQITRRLSIAAGLGFGQLELNRFQDQNFDASKSIPLWKLRAVYNLQPKTQLRFEGNTDQFYGGWLNENKQSQFLHVHNQIAEFETNAIPLWQIRSSIRNTSYKDTNRQVTVDQLILREIISGPVVVKAGVGAARTAFRRHSTSYWSPGSAESYGIRLVASKEILNKTKTEVRLNSGIHRENANDFNPDTSAEVLVEYTYKPDWKIKLNSNFFCVGGKTWRNGDVGVRAELPLLL